MKMTFAVKYVLFTFLSPQAQGGYIRPCYEEVTCVLACGVK